MGVPETEPERNIVRIWRSWDEIDARPMTSPVILPGLAWEGESSILVGDSKSGKSTLLTQSLAAMARERDFLGSPCGAGRVAILEEMGSGRLKGWLQDRGVEEWAGIDFLEPCSYDLLRAYLVERQPLLLVIDTLALFSTLNDADENGANDMRRLSLQCKATGAAVLVVHHENRQGDYRGSSDIRAAVDMAISMKRGDGDLRTLAYLGRWPQQGLTLRFTRPTLEYSIAEGDDRAVDLVNYVAENPGVTKHALREANRRASRYGLRPGERGRGRRRAGGRRRQALHQGERSRCVSSCRNGRVTSIHGAPRVASQCPGRAATVGGAGGCAPASVRRTGARGAGAPGS